MSSLFSYSFSLSTPKPTLHEYAYSEFALGLSADWKLVPNAEENTLNFHSESRGAGITISADFYEIPEGKAQALAEKCLSSRLEALEKVTPGRVQALQRTIKPHSGGVGLELSFAAEVPGEHVYIYLGYVTPRKVLNFTLVCKPGKEAAVALFNELVLNFRPRLP
jgi:hypothetical protein